MRPSLGSVVVGCVVVATSAVISPVAAQAAARAEGLEPLRTEALAPGVWVVLRDDGTRPDLFASSVVIAGRDAAVVVDAGGSPRHAERLAMTVRSLTDRPVVWIVDTHRHGDHVYGNATLTSVFSGARIVAHETVRDDLLGPARERFEVELDGHRGRLAERERWLETGLGPSGEPLTTEQVGQLETSIALRSETIADLERVELRAPDVTVSDRMELELGARRVTLHHFGPAHTEGDLVVHVPDAGVIAVGDLLEDGGLWVEGADVPGWVTVLESVMTLEGNVVVPAHGDPRMDRSLLVGEHGFLAEALAVARAACAAGEPEDDVAAAVAGADFGRYGPVLGRDMEGVRALAAAAVAQAVENLRAAPDGCNGSAPPARS